MRCPNCQSVNIKTHLVKPVKFGGANTVDYYSCKDCGVMFEKIENNPKIASLREGIEKFEGHLKISGDSELVRLYEDLIKKRSRYIVK